MAYRPKQISALSIALGVGGASLLLLPAFGAVLALLAEGSWRGSTPDAADWAALRFTLKQALLSAAISVGLGVVLARAMLRRHFYGRALLLSLFGAPFLLPVISAVLALIAIWGRGGMMSDMLSLLGMPRLEIYGLSGIILAHVFFNLPLATRMILNGWASVPQERMRLAVHLHGTGFHFWRLIEWPMLRQTLPPAFLLISLFCLTSFSVVLILGGGPGQSTLELAIYSAIRHEFDLPRAAMLTVMQACIGLVFGMFYLGLSSNPLSAPSNTRIPRLAYPPMGLRLVGDVLVLVFLGGFVLLPLGALFWAGLGEIARLPEPVWQAALVSTGIALCAATVSVSIAFMVADFTARPGRFGALIFTLAMLSLTISPLVIGSGIFLMMIGRVSPFSYAVEVTILVNALIALPMNLAILRAPLAQSWAQHGRLIQALGLSGFSRLWRITLPSIAAPLGLAFGLSAALSMGDLGVMVLFAAEDVATLPLMVYRLMGSYQMDAARGAACLLAILSFAIFWSFDAAGRGSGSGGS